jgi:hypothetical protein
MTRVLSSSFLFWQEKISCLMLLLFIFTSKRRIKKKFVLKLSILEVHPKFIIATKGTIAIGFWRLDLGTFSAPMLLTSKDLVQFNELFGGGCLPSKSCWGHLLACVWCSFFSN